MTPEIVRQLSGLVATELGDGWSVDTSDRVAEHVGCYLDGPHRARLFLRLEQGHADRVNVSGNYPDGWTRHVYPTPSVVRIGVARDRGPQAIAREITRRLLPAYHVELARILVALAEHDVATTLQSEAADALSHVLPGAYSAPSSRPEEIRFSVDRHDWYGEVRLQHDGARGNLELRSAPLELLLKVAQVLKDHAS